MASQDQIFEFGEYRLDVRERRLWHGSLLVALPPKTFDLLVVMLTGAGRLLEKEYLIRSVWPDSHVQDANLSVHIANIRKTLAKNSDVEQFIETVPKVGYRFVARVSSLLLAESALAPAAGDASWANATEAALSLENLGSSMAAPVLPPQFSTRRPALSRPILVMIVAAIACLLCIAALRFVRARRDGVRESEISTTPLAGTPGLFLQPSFSPDGQELAYTWRSNTSPYQSIYLQHVPGEDPRKLIDTGSDDYSPAWSPDGTKIAFLHSSKEDQPFELIIANKQNSALRRKVATIADADDAFRATPTLSWSPDGHTLVTTDRSSRNESPSLALVSVENGQKRQLTHTPSRTVDDQAAFSPDGTQIAFRRSQGDSSDDIYLIGSSGEQERKLTSLASPIDGLTWSTDGRRIIFSSGRATSLGNIWSLPLNGGSPTSITTPLTHTSSPAVARVGHRLAYVDSPNHMSVGRLPLDGHGRAQTFIASNFFDASAVYSPDGSHIAFRSDRSGTNEIWVCRADGSEPKRVTHFNGPVTGSPRWSPDGRSIAFDSRGRGRADIYVVNLDGEKSVQITDSASTVADNVVPAWSHDAGVLYYSSNRTGDWQIWKHLLDTGADVQITTNGGFNAVETSDGSALIYVGNMGQTEIRRLSLRQTQSDVALVSIGPGLWHSWAISGNRLIYLKRVPSSATTLLVRLDLKSNQKQTLGEVPDAVNDNISISPNGRHALFGSRSNAGSCIMILDGWN